MEDCDVFEAFEKSIRRIYVEQDLVSLRFERDGDHSFAPHGVDLFDKYINTVKEDEPVVVEEDEEVLYFDRFQIFDDLVALSDQAIYFTAFLCLLTPLINNPLDHPLDLDGYATTMFPNRQNPAAKRFDFISDTLAEKTYAYWARLGNLLNRYLEEPLEPHAVDF